MSTNRPDWNASTPVKIKKTSGEETTLWHQCGVAFLNISNGDKRESISIRLNSLPQNGELVLFKNDEKRSENAASK